MIRSTTLQAKALEGFQSLLSHSREECRWKYGSYGRVKMIEECLTEVVGVLDFSVATSRSLSSQEFWLWYAYSR